MLYDWKFLHQENCAEKNPQQELKKMEKENLSLPFLTLLGRVVSAITVAVLVISLRRKLEGKFRY
ncbi:MAG: hypothetical protein QW763_05785 [Archaeoglobaceae archaeon]